MLIFTRGFVNIKELISDLLAACSFQYLIELGNQYKRADYINRFQIFLPKNEQIMIK